MSIGAKLIRFAREPLPGKWSMIKGKLRSTVQYKRTDAADELRYEAGVAAADYAPLMNSRPRLALAGCGSSFACEAHIPALQQLEREGLVELVALCSRTEDSLSRAAEKYGERKLKRYKHLDSVLADPEIDLVDLVLPIAAMPEAISASLHAGKHVISEKPCAPTVAQCLELLNDYASLDSPPFWAVAENWRFKSTPRIVERIVKSGRIGTIYLADFIHLTRAVPSIDWRGSSDYPGGHLVGWGVHFIALLRQVVGEIAQVSATVSQHRTYLPPADSLTAAINFENGAEGSFQLSFALPPFAGRAHVPELTLIGSEGTLHVDFNTNVIALRDLATERLISVPDDSFVQGGVHRLLAHCLGALQHSSPLRSSPSEALRDVAVMEAMLESSRRGKPVSPSSLHPTLHGSGPRIATFGGVWTFRPKHIVDCGSVDDVRSAVMESVSAKLRVRPMGVAHSWASELLTRDVCLRLCGLNRIQNVDATRKTVVVDAGVRLGDLTRVLASHGLSLPSLPYITNATVGGAVASGTHGTSPKWGTLSDFVRSMKVVLASGEIREFGPASPPEELRAARVAVGMLGVIVELEIEAITMPWVRYTEFSTDLSTFLAQWSALLSHSEHVWGHWILGEDKVRVDCLEAASQSAKGARPYVVHENAGWTPLSSSSGGPELTARQRLVARGVVPSNMGMQYGVPLSQIETAIESIRASDFAARNSGRVVELKFLKGEDRSFLGPNVERDSVLFNLGWVVDENLKGKVFENFENTMRNLHAQPHWGKFHLLPDLEYMKKAYPRWCEFEAVRSRFDPGGTFSIFP
jgi:predicted dehydrogenase